MAGPTPIFGVPTIGAHPSESSRDEPPSSQAPQTSSHWAAPMQLPASRVSWSRVVSQGASAGALSRGLYIFLT